MKKILLVEGDMDLAEKCRQRLSGAGYEVICVHDGRQGLQAAKDEAPDLIITDAVLPLVNGYELCKAARQDAQTQSIPVVVITEKHRMEEAFVFLGIRDLLNKPVDLDELEKLVTTRLWVSQASHPQKTTILINGKSEVLASCSELLKTSPYWDGHFNDNNASFLAEAVKCGPDVVCVDLLMPGVCADELIKKMKQTPELKEVVILTYYATASIARDPLAIQAQMIEVQYMKRLTQEAGAAEYIGPFNPVTFLRLIDIYRKDLKM